MKTKIRFFMEFLKNPKSIGSIIRSSHSLRDSLISHIDFSSDLCIFEYGPGDGIFTELIYSKMSTDSTLYIIESNIYFVKTLRLKYKDCYNVEIIYDSVENITKICNNRNIKSIDYIVSGIPFLSLGKDFLNKVFIDSSKLLTKKFILFQYTSKLELEFTKIFKHIFKYKIKNNIPPAYIYILEN